MAVVDVAGGGGVDEAAGIPSYRLPPLPGLPVVGEDRLRTGGLDDLLAIYGGLGSGRLVVIGAPGSGKSAAAIRLMLDALKHRSGFDDGKRSTIPVPLLLTVHGWDPIRQPLVDWLAGRLTADYPLLSKGASGRRAAARLVESGRVAVVLDGLDEMPDALRPIALRALDEQVRFRLVVLTRSAEMVSAVAAGRHLSGAAGLELMVVDAQDAADYLSRCQVQPMPAAWQRLVRQIRLQPDGTDRTGARYAANAFSGPRYIPE